MVEMGKQYQTRDGREVDIFAIKDGRVWGRERTPDGDWVSNSWAVSNVAPYLIEVKAKITATYWLLHWINSDWHATVGPTREYLDQNFRKDERLAITGPHHVEFTEGEGLEPSR